MKQGYMIRIESENPDFEVGSELREGKTVDGFLLLTVRDGKPESICMNNMTIMQLAGFFNPHDKCGIYLCQAAAIGEGIQKAAELRREYYGNGMCLELSGSLTEEEKRQILGL